MRKFKTEERARAIMRGLQFIYVIACDEEHFAAYGHDLLNCFYFISATSSDPSIRVLARKMGRERALVWRREHRRLPRDADADLVAKFVHGNYAADRLGYRDPALKAQLRQVAGRITARDYFWFDPTTEPPPKDVTAPCEGCGLWNERGRKTCRQCRKRLAVVNRYLLWYDALVMAYNGERIGVRIGARFVDVLRWLPLLRPYRGSENGANTDFYHCLYAVTHIVYTLNDYSAYRLAPGWLPQEFAFLKANLSEAVDCQDPEMMGEFLDSLKAFGLRETHPLIRAGMDYLLSCQNDDGSWGDLETDDIYARYHPTWTAIDGLREYAWRGLRLSFPKLKPMLLAMNRTHH